ncbi:MAG: tautomerase family protein [Ramlibacter sp.]|nr:tautomerase family protein [Ramlibacter sp.]
MPTLNLRIAPLQNPDRYQALAAALTEITARTLDKRAAVTAVVIEDLPAARWWIGGRDLQRPTALLEISVTTGTNTPAQKAAFIAQAHAELQRQLAPGATLEEASYVIVREVPAADWGYAGQTQLARQHARQQAPAARDAVAAPAA